MAAIAQILSNATKSLIPFSVMVEINQSCNLKCSHCYIAKDDSGNQGLSLSEYEDIFKQLAESGSLFMTITGGEPLLHPDFFEIVKIAKKHNFAVSLFTNGTKIDDGVAGKIAESGVYEVGISLLGSTAEIHDSITRVTGSFARAISAIEYLRKKGVATAAKFTFMKSNVSDFDNVRDLAKKLEANFTFGYFIATKTDGSTAPLRQRLSENDLTSLQSNYYLFPEETRVALDVTMNKKILDQNICKAGIDTCAISSTGELYPCIFLPKVGSLREKRFSDIWNSSIWLRDFRNLKHKDVSGCSTCDLLYKCGRCPGLTLLEEKDIKVPHRFACLVAKTNVLHSH